MLSVHDNEIISYEVELRNHRITIQTIRPRDSALLKIIFSNVFAHLFECHLEGSIILDVKGHELSHFFKGNRELLENQNGLHENKPYNDTNHKIENFLRSAGYL